MSKQTAADTRYGRRGSHIAYDVSRRCINCGKDSTPRYLYCSDACSIESRAKSKPKAAA